jgi:hypothetical protein
MRYLASKTDGYPDSAETHLKVVYRGASYSSIFAPGDPHLLRSSWTPVGLTHLPSSVVLVCLFISYFRVVCISGSTDYPEYWTRHATVLVAYNASGEQLSIPIVSETRLSRGADLFLLHGLTLHHCCLASRFIGTELPTLTVFSELLTYSRVE